MAKHTPKPWQYHAEDMFISSVEDRWAVLADIEHLGGGVRVIPAEERDANGVLMAAAPELLEALQELLSRVDLVLYRRYVGGNLIDKCRAAIQKATQE